jgi:uncharacterized protein YecA (UPF0149 family)
VEDDLDGDDYDKDDFDDDPDVIPFPIERRSVGRNEPCPCGSGKKYKKCHGATA